MNPFFVQDEELKEVAKEILRKTKDVASQITIRELLRQVNLIYFL
jgi:hypothetical protein